MSIYSTILPYIAIYGHIWPYMDIYDQIWPYMAIYGHIMAIYMAIYGPYMVHIWAIYGPKTIFRTIDNTLNRVVGITKMMPKIGSNRSLFEAGWLRSDQGEVEGVKIAHRG